jgi:hypothetical protein
VDEGTLGVHEIELVVESCPGSGDGGGAKTYGFSPCQKPVFTKHLLGEHAKATSSLGEVAAGNASGGFVADTKLETGRAPVHELNGSLRLDGGDGSLGILGDDVTTIEESAGH